MDIKKKILITGGAGYIGVPVIEELINKNLDIIVLDRFSFDIHSLETFSKYKNLRIINGDIRDNNILSENLKNVDTVIHLAALVGEAACKISEEETKSINFDATINLCKLAKKYSVKKFIFMSTASSYGVQDVNEIADEETKLNPVSLYARTKIDSEKSILDNFSEDLDISIFRPSTVYGHSLRMRFDLILNHLIKDAIQKKEIKVFGPDMVRPLMWVGEPARVYSKIIDDETSKYKSQIFNLGYNNENYKKIDIAKIVQENFFKDINIDIVEKDLDLRSYRLNFDKMKKYFDLSPASDLLRESEIIIKNIKNNFYGDINSKKYYNV
ncbi:SDR family oxidoreductase [Candidatus Pelagibacter sp.]|nr:SDR family oxidoreductase [Candidatus Pelagibacter sp.]